MQFLPLGSILCWQRRQPGFTSSRDMFPVQARGHSYNRYFIPDLPLQMWVLHYPVKLMRNPPCRFSQTTSTSPRGSSSCQAAWRPRPSPSTRSAAPSPSPWSAPVRRSWNTYDQISEDNKNVLVVEQFLKKTDWLRRGWKMLSSSSMCWSKSSRNW